MYVVYICIYIYRYASTFLSPMRLHLYSTRLSCDLLHHTILGQTTLRLSTLHQTSHDSTPNPTSTTVKLLARKSTGGLSDLSRLPPRAYKIVGGRGRLWSASSRFYNFANSVFFLLFMCLVTSNPSTSPHKNPALFLPSGDWRMTFKRSQTRSRVSSGPRDPSTGGDRH